MSAATLKNVSATERLQRGEVLRVSFAQDHTAVARADTFSADMSGLWRALHNVGGAAYPITPNPSIRGDTASVVDLKLSAPAVLGTLLDAIDTASGYWIKTTGVEKLTVSAAAAAPSNAGAAQRDVVRQQVEKDNDDANPFNKIANTLGTTLRVAKWLVVAVVFVVAVVYLSPLLKQAAKK